MNNVMKALSSSAVKGSSKIVVFIAGTIIMFILTIGLFSRAVIAYNDMQTVKTENANMKTTISKWKNAVSYIEKQEYRPISQDQLNNVNSDILVAIQVHNLTLADFKASPIGSSGDKKDPFQVFTMKLTGQYGDLVKFLTTFHAKDALVSLMTLELNTSDKQLVSATISYRVYIK